MTARALPLEDYSFLVSPTDRTPLRRVSDEELEDARGKRFPIVNGIPRFVPRENYAASFGLQWNAFQRTQLDKYSGLTITRDRFFADSRWNPEELRGQRILEVGGGAGRFTQIALDAGAEVYSVDYSDAVDANLRNNGPHPRLHLIQASVYEMPLPLGWFDKAFCFGVLQHTPDPRRSFMSIVPYLKPGGQLAVDVYAKTWKTWFWTKYWWRPLTTRMKPDTLLRLLRTVIPAWYPVGSLLHRVPKVGYQLSQLLPIAVYDSVYRDLDRKAQLEWSVMDTFDMLAPQYDQPQSLATLRRWFSDAGLELLHSGVAADGGPFVGVGRMPARATSA